MQPTRSLDDNESTAHSNPLRPHLSGGACSEVMPSPAVPSIFLVDHDVNATKRALSHLPHPVPQETTNLTDPIFIVDLGVDPLIDLLFNDGSVHSKINNIACEPSLDLEQLDRPHPGSLQRESHSRSSNPPTVTLPLPSPLSNKSTSSVTRATRVHARQQEGFTAVTPACTEATTTSSTGSQSLTSPPYQLGLRQQSQDAVLFANETIEDRCKHPNPSPSRYPPEYKPSDTIKSLNTPKSPYTTQYSPLIFCPEIPPVIPPDSVADVHHDTLPIFIPELPLLPPDSRPDPPSNSHLDPLPIFIPDLPCELFPDPQTAEHCPDLGNDRAPNFTFSPSRIGRPAESEGARNLRTTENSPSQEPPLALLAVNNGVPELSRYPKAPRNDGSRELTQIFTFDLSDGHPVNTFGDHLPLSFAVSLADGGRKVKFSSIGGDPATRIPTTLNEKLISVEHENPHSGSKLGSSPTIGSNQDYVIGSRSLHWKGRWDVFPLRQVTFGQTKSVHDRLLLKCRNDMDWDEMNLDWLTDELLLQRFSLPVRTNMRSMELIRLTKYLGFRGSPVQSK